MNDICIYFCISCLPSSQAVFPVQMRYSITLTSFMATVLRLVRSLWSLDWPLVTWILTIFTGTPVEIVLSLNSTREAKKNLNNLDRQEFLLPSNENENVKLLSRCVTNPDDDQKRKYYLQNTNGHFFCPVIFSKVYFMKMRLRRWGGPRLTVARTSTETHISKNSMNLSRLAGNCRLRPQARPGVLGSVRFWE